MYLVFKNCLNWLGCLALLLLAFQFQFCKKDDLDENPKPSEPTHISNLVENSGWSTVSYSQEYYTNNKYSEIPPRIPALWELAAAEIGPNGPNFIIKETSQNWITDPTYSYQMMVKEGDKLLKYTTQIPYGKTSITSPVNLAAYDLQQDFDYYKNRTEYNPLFYNNSFYGWSDLLKEGNTPSANKVRFIIKDGGLSYGWFNYVNARSLSSDYFDTWATNAMIERYGNVFLTELNNQTAMIYGGKFYSPVKQENIFCMTAKYWSSATDSIDLVSVINHNGELYDDDYCWIKSCRVGDKILAGFNLTLDRDLHLVFGDFTNGFNVIPANVNGGDVFYLVEGESEAFLISGKTTDVAWQVIKIDENGNLTDYGAVLDNSKFFQIKNLTVYKGDLVMAVSTVNDEYLVYRITVAGMQVLGSPDMLKSTYMSGSLYVVADQNNLYAVIQNCVSPVYVDEDDFQLCGWELIKYND